MLYTVNKSPFTNDNLQGCLKVAPAGSAILLYEDGVFGATTGTKIEGLVKEAMGRVKLYALKEDLAARGLSHRVIPGIEVIDYSGFVDLVEKHPVVPWL